MIVLDTSAIMAILLHESEKPELLECWAAAEGSMIAAPTLLECHLVIAGKKILPADLEALLAGAGTHIVPFDEPLLRTAISAHAKYGKGRHKAALNFGDCMSYALAKKRKLPLLAKGDDFAHTDVKLAA